MRTHKLFKSARPDDLVLQSVQTGRPLNGQNILKTHIQPAARKVSLPFVNWRCLRDSHATWLVQEAADPKSVQGQMRHSRLSTQWISTRRLFLLRNAPCTRTIGRVCQRCDADARSNSRSITVEINGFFRDQTWQEKSASD